MKKRALQKNLPKTPKLTTEQVVQFLDDFQNLVQNTQENKSTLISLRVPQGLLRTFRVMADQQGVPYQSLIKDLMRAYVSKRRS